MKYENTRIVEFKEDYYVKAKEGGKKLLHKKGSRHAMHKGIVDILNKNGAKIDVKKLDVDKAHEKAKKQFQEARKKQTAAMYG